MTEKSAAKISEGNQTHILYIRIISAVVRINAKNFPKMTDISSSEQIISPPEYMRVYLSSSGRPSAVPKKNTHTHIIKGIHA